jgi:hypothetical protein
MPESAAAVAAYLYSHKDATEALCPAAGAIYAVFIHNGMALLPVMTAEPGLVYVGVTEDAKGFYARGSGFCTLRRSLGAILKERLSLQAVPRGKGQSISNIRNFSFTEDGEARLEAWMRQHLRHVSYPVQGEAALLEKDVIRLMQPPLCLSGWANKQAAMIRRMRKVCADEAWEMQQKVRG